MAYNYKGLFLSFEGTDGAGKSTHLILAKDVLEGNGHDNIICTREPGGTEVAEEIRKVLLIKHDEKVDDWTEALLYAAARAQHVKRIILPYLEEGKIVLCDRYVDSSYAYQGIVRGLGLKKVKMINKIATYGLMPDRTFLLYRDSDKAFRSMIADNRKLDRIESEGSDFQRKVLSAFLKLAKADVKRIKLIEVLESKTKSQVHAEIMKDIENVFIKKYGRSYKK